MEDPVIISIGRSRTDKKWRQKDMSWDDICSMLGSFLRTKETMREYRAMSKEEQGRVKDVGGFVGGKVEGGRRVNTAVTERSLVTLDADNAYPGQWEDVVALWNMTMCCYSTHSSTPEKPRLRFVIPLKRAVSPEEYQAVSRKLGERVDLETLDPSTHELARLMYFPSCSIDAEPMFAKHDGELVDPDDVLAEYGPGEAWKDSTLWPIAKAEQEIRVKEAKRMGDPTEKPGIVGLFCRAYTIEDAMDELIPGVYEPCGEGRFTYAAGSTAGGAVLYDNGKFLFSHHGTDPCGGMEVNAFDLVRVHKFGELDAGLENQEVTRRPSYQAMCEYAAGLDKVKQQKAAEQDAVLDDLVAAEPVGLDEENPSDWVKKLDINHKTGAVELSLKNLLLIIQNDPALKGVAAYNLLKCGPVMLKRAPWDDRKDPIPEGGEPWMDSDNAGLRWYMETKWGLVGKDKIQDALDLARTKNAFDPVKDYLLGLQWDGVERLDTMFVRWMGAEDNKYVRAVTRKWMCGAVARTMQPGCKFDNMLVLVGEQGTGKSNFGAIISRGWYTNSLGKMDASKDSYERLFGVWIVEVAELASTKKAEIEDVKNFVTKQEDQFRKAFGHEQGIYRRRCVFYGNTNDYEFLRDRTGNRRFWPIGVKDVDRGQLIGLAENRDQIWAEAVVRWKEGETLWLDDAELYDMARQVQEEHTVRDDWADDIEAYLDTLLPEDWDNMDALQRRDYFDFTSNGSYAGLGASKKEGTRRRDRVSGKEIRWELFGIRGDQGRGGNDGSARRISNIMNTMPGWKKIKDPYKDRCYGSVRGWERKGMDE